MPESPKFRDVIGIDIGGANIKISCVDGVSASQQFPMWTDYHRLGSAIKELLDVLGTGFRETTCLAITMTGEMADCFNSRREGVAAILDGVTSVIPDDQIAVYAVGGKWLTIEQAKLNPWQVAASNWHALVSWLLLQQDWHLDQCNVVLDIGSTTVDIIPVRDRKIATEAKTDRERMQLGQLVYTGMERTAIHAIVQELQVKGQSCPVVAEKFATSLDAHLILGNTTEAPQNCDTADGKPRTRHYALARMARMVGEDTETIGESEVISLANQVLDAQVDQISKALLRNLPSSSPSMSVGTQAPFSRSVFVSGHGRPLLSLLRKRAALADVQWRMLDELVTPLASRCAPALAVAQLYRDQQA